MPKFYPISVLGARGGTQEPGTQKLPNAPFTCPVTTIFPIVHNPNNRPEKRFLTEHPSAFGFLTHRPSDRTRTPDRRVVEVICFCCCPTDWAEDCLPQ